MKITILCSDALHPVNAHLRAWINENKGPHQVDLIRSTSEIAAGDLLFLISCSEIVTVEMRRNYSKVLVIHASDLPRGRGWSPHVWEIAGGATTLTVSLLEAEEKVDSGDIWKKISIVIDKGALWSEISQLLFEAELELMDFAVESFGAIEPHPQPKDIQPTYYRKRTPEDSRIDPNKSIESQFNLIRACDPDRFPPYFELHGFRYLIRLERA